MLVALTNALGLHWATGQSSLEDANLAAAMAWIDPPAGITGPEAARVAEDPLVWPPAGPATDPVFDNEVLAPAIRAYDEAPAGSLAQDRALAVLTRTLRGQLEPTWRLMWRAIARLRELPPGDSVAQRWAKERQQFTNFAEYVNGGGLPQARRDGAVAAARRLNLLEREQANYDAERAFDDPLVMANHRVTGEAFVGAVVKVDRDRRVPNDKGNLVTRPLVTVHTEDPVYLSLDTKVVAVSRRNQHGSITSIDGQDGARLVTLQLNSGMGKSKVPPAGSVPEVGERLCYTSVLPDNTPSPTLPPVDETPWTHGGPPQPYVPTDDDAREVWE
jgi:hypothetical protein